MDTPPIFISSPGDVAEERELDPGLAARLAQRGARPHVPAPTRWAAVAGLATLAVAASIMATAADDADLDALEQAFALRQEALELTAKKEAVAAVAKVDEALELVRGDAPPARQFRAALLDTRAFAHVAAADQERVAADSLAAAAIWRTLGAEQEEPLAGSLLAAGFALIQTKRDAEAVRVLVEARDILAGDPARRDGRLLHALSLLATAAGNAGERGLQRKALVDHVKLAAALGGRNDEAHRVHLALLGEAVLGAPVEAGEHLDTWLDEAIAAGTVAEVAPRVVTAADALLQAGDYARALAIATRLADWQRSRRPRDDLGLAAALEQAGRVTAAAGDFTAAEAAFREACDLLAAGHPREHAIELAALATMRSSLGRYVEAEADFSAALEAMAPFEGPDRIHRANTLGGLGTLNLLLGDFGRARLRLAEAAREAEAIGGPVGERVAGQQTVQLAIAEALAGDHAAAREHFERGHASLVKALGADHPSLLVMAQARAGIELEVGGDLDAVETQLTETLERVRALPGGGGSIEAQALDTLAEVRLRRGDRTGALALAADALDHRARAGGERSLVFVRSLLRMAEVRGLDDPASRADVERALDLCDQLLGPAFATLSERQQLAAAAVAHRALGVRLSLPADDDPAAVAALHGRILRWKGAIFARQRQVRRALADPRAAAIASELRAVAGRIAALARQPESPARREALVALTDRRDAAERALAAAAGGGPGPTVSSATVAAALPEDTVLVDYLEFTTADPVGDPPEKKPEKRLTAFVLRRGREPVRIDLGPSAAVTEALAAWRPWEATPPEAAGRAAADLRRLAWQPLAAHLAGAAVVLLSPDGCLAEVPFAALPGADGAGWLLDEVLLAHVSVPALVPQSLADRREGRAGGEVLLVGNVDFGKPRAGPNDGDGLHDIPDFEPLPGTATEIAAIADLAADLDPPLAGRRLEGAAATVGAVRRDAADARYIHLATHGFFADARAAAADRLTRGIAGTAALPAFAGLGGMDDGGLAAGLHPGALAGIALAGANAPGNVAEGILTALDVADLDLPDTELVVLSACDTRRGRQAAGEGLLGLQRAFEVAGARTVVAALWQVDDEATAELMRSFYDNLWRRRLPRAAALREAQRHVARLHALPGGPERPRGVAGAAPLPTRGPLPAAYWGGFILSGDWR